MMVEFLADSGMGVASIRVPLESPRNAVISDAQIYSRYGMHPVPTIHTFKTTWEI